MGSSMAIRQLPARVIDRPGSRCADGVTDAGHLDGPGARRSAKCLQVSRHARHQLSTFRVGDPWPPTPVPLATIAEASFAETRSSRSSCTCRSTRLAKRLEAAKLQRTGAQMAVRLGVAWSTASQYEQASGTQLRRMGAEYQLLVPLTVHHAMPCLRRRAVPYPVNPVHYLDVPAFTYIPLPSHHSSSSCAS